MTGECTPQYFHISRYPSAQQLCRTKFTASSVLQEASLCLLPDHGYVHSPYSQRQTVAFWPQPVISFAALGTSNKCNPKPYSSHCFVFGFFCFPLFFWRLLHCTAPRSPGLLFTASTIQSILLCFHPFTVSRHLSCLQLIRKSVTASIPVHISWHA